MLSHFGVFIHSFLHVFQEMVVGSSLSFIHVDDAIKVWKVPVQINSLSIAAAHKPVLHLTRLHIKIIIMIPLAELPQSLKKNKNKLRSPFLSSSLKNENCPKRVCSSCHKKILLKNLYEALFHSSKLNIFDSQGTYLVYACMYLFMLQCGDQMSPQGE